MGEEHNDSDGAQNNILQGEEARALLIQGKDAWNSKMQSNPRKVTFKEVDFTKLALPDTFKLISFAVFHFPKGVDFSGAQFGEGSVNFRGAQFGEGKVSFNRAQFGEGSVNFRGAQFGEGDVSFMEAQFGEGDVYFVGAQFGEGVVSFGGAQFGEGDVSFMEAQFGEGDVYFVGAQFGEGVVSFGDAQFGEGDVYFVGAQFGEGVVSFGDAQFGQGDVSFIGAQFCEGSVDFSGAQFGEGSVDFSGAQFGEGDVSFIEAQFCKGSRVKFTDIKVKGKFSFIVEPIFSERGVDFRGSSFGSVLQLDGLKSNGPIDLRETTISHHISLSDTQIKLPRKWTHKPPFLIAHDGAVSAQFRRLKELAISANDHERQLDFFAKEMRAARGYDTKWLPLILDMLYDLFSKYGTSIWRPLIGLLVLWLGFSGIYAKDDQLSVWSDITEGRMVEFLVKDSSIYSLGQTIPFTPSSRAARVSGEDGLSACVAESGHEEKCKDGEFRTIYYWSILQNLMAAMLFFLLGLALRNRFRL